MSIMKLNVVMTYPIKWSEYRVINNYVQNFYDALGIEQFINGFHYEMVGDTLIMKSDKGFAKEWLFFMGASSKRDDNKKHAGGFGEGFKVASLVAYRDFNLSIRMESRDWTLTVTEVMDEIDGKETKFLAYDIGERAYEENSILILGNATENLLKETEKQVNNFFYKGNPILGECIADMGDYAIYHANKNDKEKKVTGVLFASYQIRASLRVPLIICNHIYHPEDDRDRDELGIYEMKECIDPVIESLDSESALKVLELMNVYWNDTREKGYTPFEWYGTIKRLIFRVRLNAVTREKFQNKYKDRLVTSFGPYVSNNRKKIAKEWFRKSGFQKKRRVVNYIFRELEIQAMEELCEENNGFVVEAYPNEREKEYINILEKAAKSLLAEIYGLEQFPDCKILLNKEAPMAGYTKIVVDRDGKKNIYGLKVVRRADYIYLQKYNFMADCFGRAFSVYAHELLHQFGGDSSIQFRKALLLMNISLAKNGDKLKEFEEEWRNVR